MFKRSDLTFDGFKKRVITLSIDMFDIENFYRAFSFLSLVEVILFYH